MFGKLHVFRGRLEDAVEFGPEAVEHGGVRIGLNEQLEHERVLSQRGLVVALLLGLVGVLECLVGVPKQVCRGSHLDRRRLEPGHLLGRKRRR